MKKSKLDQSREFECLPEAVMIVDDSGRLTDANQAAAALSGYTCAALVGLPTPNETRTVDRVFGQRCIIEGDVVGWCCRLLLPNRATGPMSQARWPPDERRPPRGRSDAIRLIYFDTPWSPI